MIFFPWLSTETEFLDDISVSLDIDFLEVVKNTTSLTDQLQKRKTCYMVFLVVLQMLGKVSDTVGKQSNLTLRRAGVLIRLSVLRENLLPARNFSGANLIIKSYKTIFLRKILIINVSSMKRTQ